MKRSLTLIFSALVIIGCRSGADRHKGSSIEPAPYKDGKKEIGVPESEKALSIPELITLAEPSMDTDAEDIAPAYQKEEMTAGDTEYASLQKAQKRTGITKNNDTNNIEIKDPDGDTHNDGIQERGIIDREGKITEIITAGIDQEIHDKNLDLSNIDGVKIKELGLRELKADEGEAIMISLEYPHWILKSVEPDLLVITGRESGEKNTVFEFRAGSPSVISLIFLRYEENINTLWRQPYKVTVLPRSLFKIKTESVVENSRNMRSQESAPTKKKTDEAYGREKETADRLYEQKDYAEAKKRYQAMINGGSTDSEIYYKMGVMFKNEKDLKKAVENFKLALNDRGGIYYLDSMIEIIKILKDQKRYGEAVDLFYKYGFNEDLPAGTAEELYIMIADLYYNMKDYKSAAKEYRRFIEEFPASKDLAKAMFYLANSIENFDRDPDYKEAYRIYKIIIEEYPVSGYSSLAKNRMLVLERDYLKVF